MILPTISKRIVLSFLESCFIERNLSPRTVLSYRASLQLPLSEAFKINFSDDEFRLLSRAHFLNRPPVKCLIPQWSLGPVLAMLAGKEFTCSYELVVNVYHHNWYGKTVSAAAVHMW